LFTEHLLRFGRAISQQFAADGATVVMVARDPAKGDATHREIAEHGGRAEFVSIQLGDDGAVRDLIQKIEREQVALHVIVNCPGGDPKARGIEPSSVMEDWNLMSANNLLSAYLVTTYGVEIMKRTGGAEGWRQLWAVVLLIPEKGALNWPTAYVFMHTGQHLSCRVVKERLLSPIRQTIDKKISFHIRQSGTLSTDTHMHKIIPSPKCQRLTGIHTTSQGLANRQR
jgi:NAD(P)-dependent dehydrogenase (short-subunit alcohol dehydrogenase family)